MQDDLALKIVIALREEINRHPEMPADEELADVVRPLLADPAEVAQALKWGVDPAEDPSKSAVWPLANDVEPTKGKWRRYDPTIWGLPTHPSTQELYDARFDTHERAIRGEIPEAWGTREGDVCLRNGCQGIMAEKWTGKIGSPHLHNFLRCDRCCCKYDPPEITDA